MIRLTEAELRAVVQREVRRRLEEDAGYEEGMDAFADRIAQETLTVLRNVGTWELVKIIERTMDWDNAMLPERWEDVEPHAYELADRVADKMGRVLHPFISDIVLQVIQRAMKGTR